MILKGKIVKLSSVIEEEVILEINGLQIEAFICLCSYKIEEGKTYNIELNFVFLDDEKFDEISDEKYNIQKIDKDSYAYKLTGKVTNGSLDIGGGVKIEDEMFDEYKYLEGAFIELEVDRISVDFV